jgi:hypothetical protein
MPALCPTHLLLYLILIPCDKNTNVEASYYVLSLSFTFVLCGQTHLQSDLLPGMLTKLSCLRLIHTPASLLGEPGVPRHTLVSQRQETFYTYPPMKIEQSVPKRRHIKFRRRGITQKKAYSRKQFDVFSHFLNL